MKSNKHDNEITKTINLIVLLIVDLETFKKINIENGAIKINKNSLTEPIENPLIKQLVENHKIPATKLSKII